LVPVFSRIDNGLNKTDETSWELFAKECGVRPKTLYKYYSEIKTAVNEADEEFSGFPYDDIKAVFKERLRLLRKWIKH